MENEPKVVVVDLSARSTTITTELVRPTAEPYLAIIKDLNSTEVSEARKKVFQNIAFDPLGTFADMALRFVVGIQGSRKGGDTIQIQDYNPAIEKMYEIITSTAAKGVNTIMLAHWQLEKDSVTERIRQTPLVWGKTLPTVIYQWFSTAIEAKKDPFRWNTRVEGWITAMGTRLVDNLPPTIDPNFEKFFKVAGREGMPTTVLLVGEPFTGKTYSLATLPGKVLLFNLQPEGYQSLRCPYKVYKRLDEYWKEVGL